MKNLIQILAIVSWITLSSCLQNQQTLKIGRWMTDWHVCGPFPLEVIPESEFELEHLPGFEIDFLQSSGGETATEIDLARDFTIKNSTYSWQRYTAPDSIINLDAAVSQQSYVAAYAFREFYSTQELTCFLSIGSNDGGRLWLNGARIWDRPTPGSVIPDDELIPVVIRKGRNTLLIKVEERGNIWGFCTRLLPLDTDIRPGTFFKIHPKEDGSVHISFLYNNEVIAPLFRETNMTIRSINEDRLLWQGPWSKTPTMKLAVDTSHYAHYVLSFTGRLSNGEEWKENIPFTAGHRHDYTLFENGRTDYTICVDKNASDSEQWAARELQHWLGEISGAFFPVQTDRPSSAPAIFIGYDTALESEIGGQDKPPGAKDESYTYQNIGEHIYIRGGPLRGSMYGVFSFLENELGVRWYTPSVTLAPKRDKFVFDYLYDSQSPGIRVRNDFYFEAFDPLWAARNKVNGAMAFRDQPGGVEGYWSVHTFYRFLPPDEFYKTHPEYYSQIDGQRIHQRAQLCLTNPDVLDILTERLRQTMRENPQYLIYSVSQNDWGNPCQCADCQAIARAEKSEAGPLIRFVNKVAQRIESEFPDKFVGTLAYTYTRKPPLNIKPRDNVVIRLCSIECCFAHDFKSCPENASFLSDLRGWAGVAQHLYIWDYVVNFSHYIMPYPNFAVLQPNIQTFRENKAIGIMEQAAYQSRGGEFAELRAYLLAKLLWNPDADVEHIIDDFMYGYYGRSGQYIRAYFDLLHNQVTADTHIRLGLKPEDKLFSESFIQEADSLFDKAENVADSEIRRRVDMARLPLLYLKCKRSPVLSKSDGTYQRFCETVEREGITHYAERGAPHAEAFHRFVNVAK